MKIIEIPGINLDLRGVPRLLSPVRDSIPVWLAALRPRVAEIAAKVADGVIGHPLWTQRWIDGVIAPRVDQALAAAGRDPDAFSVQLWVWAAPGGNEERSLHAARTIVDFYVRMPTHAEFFRAEGWGDEADRVAAEPGRPVDTIPAEMARHFVLLGSIDEVAAILRDRARHATSLCVAPPMTAGGSQMVESAVAIHEALHRADLLAPGAMT